VTLLTGRVQLLRIASENQESAYVISQTMATSTSPAILTSATPISQGAEAASACVIYFLILGLTLDKAETIQDVFALKQDSGLSEASVS
jgi:hypothetical protein